MNIQKTNYQPGFKAKLNVISVAKDMIGTEQIAELTEMSKKLGADSDEFTLLVGKKYRDFVDKHHDGGVFERYPMVLKMKINNIPVDKDFSQSAHVGDGITEKQMPFEIIKNWMNSVINASKS